MTLDELFKQLEQKHPNKFGDAIKVQVFDSDGEEIYFLDCMTIDTNLNEEDFIKYTVTSYEFKDQYGYDDMKEKQAYIIDVKETQMTIFDFL